MEKQNKKGISLLGTLLLMGSVPLLFAAIIMIVLAAFSIKSEVETETYEKLRIGAEAVNQYFAYDVIANGDVDYDEYSDHEFMECAKEENVDLTLFKGDTRLLTSLKKEDGTYNEGSQASAEVYAAVSKGEVFTSDDVIINGIDYYVYYEPMYDGNNAFWGIAFAGTPQDKVKTAITGGVVKLILSAAVVAIVFCIIIAILAIRIKKSITIVANSINTLSEGDMSVHIDISDAITEIKGMIASTNRLQEKMSEVIGVVKDNTENLSTSIETVHAAAGSSAEGARQITGAMEELAHSTLALSENVQNVNAQAITMGDYIQGITDNVQTLSNASDDIKEATENAQTLMSNVLDSSDQSAEATKEIGESITLTNESIVKITDAVNLITEIASQTNLLSLNASIEAARAGEAGKGFAVVAEEIGKLAMDSADTANTIKELAEDMNNKSAKTVELAGKIGNIITEEKKTVESTQRAFESLGASIEESLAMITEIDHKATELTGIKDGILSNISDLSAISEENAASNEEVTASVTGISEGVNDMSVQSDAMKALSEELQEAVSYFK